MDTHETVSVNDPRVAHLSTDVNAKLELIIKDSNGGILAVRQPSKSRTTTASDPPLSSSTCVTQSSSSVLSSTMKWPPMNSRALCNDYASISPFEGTNINGQFNDDNSTVYKRVIVKLTCMNKGISSFNLLFERY
uniref:Uncharacterized protein n=1 Tax=Trichobilharzia regenti TaxID=157069 RepID=A0AA85J118_TRIRE|nr:unnamed protein product [Trichobilharzia regenti]